MQPERRNKTDKVPNRQKSQRLKVSFFGLICVKFFLGRCNGRSYFSEAILTNENKKVKFFKNFWYNSVDMAGRFFKEASLLSAEVLIPPIGKLRNWLFFENIDPVLISSESPRIAGDLIEEFKINGKSKDPFSNSQEESVRKAIEEVLRIGAKYRIPAGKVDGLRGQKNRGLFIMGPQSQNDFVPWQEVAKNLGLSLDAVYVRLEKTLGSFPLQYCPKTLLNGTGQVSPALPNCLVEEILKQKSKRRVIEEVEVDRQDLGLKAAQLRRELFLRRETPWQEIGEETQNKIWEIVEAGKEAKRRILKHIVLAGDVDDFLKGIAAAEIILEANKGLELKQIDRRPYKPSFLPDLKAQADIGMLFGVEDYDRRKGYKFSTYVFPKIRASLNEFDPEDRLGITKEEKLLINKVRRVEELLEVRIGRKPTISEIAKQAGISEEQVREAMELREVGVVYLEEVLRQSSGSMRGCDLPWEEMLSLDGQTRKTEESIIQKEEIHFLGSVLEKLQPNERKVLVLCLGFDYEHTEVGEMMGVTRQRIEELLERAIRKVQSREASGRLEKRRQGA